MINWFQTTTRHFGLNDEGTKTVRKTDNYLIDAVSFTEAEARMVEQMEQITTSNFTIVAIKRANYADVFNYETGDIWFKFKVSWIDINEASGKETKTSNYILVYAKDIEEATARLHEELKEMIVPYNVSAVSDSMISDVFPYFERKE